MGQTVRSASKSPFGIGLPSDVVGAAIERLNDIVMVTAAGPFEEPGLRVLYVNSACEKLSGYAPGELVGRSPRFLYGQDTAKSEIRRLEEALAARQPARAELLNYRKNGTRFWVEIEATSVVSPSTGGEYFVFIERDISERKNAERAVVEHERAMAALFANLPGMAYRRRNDPFWTMEFVSAGCRELTGFEPAALTGPRAINFEEIIDFQDRSAVRESVTRALERGEAFELSYRIRSRDGAVKWVWERGRGIPDREGSARQIEGFITDITERKLLETQVVQNQRLESIGTLAGGIAHDLNNVFAPIMMAADLLTEKEAGQPSNPLVDTIAGSAKRGAGLVRQILLFARGMEGRRIAVSPTSLFSEIRTFLDSTFPKSIRVETHVDTGVPSLAGDPTQLYQVLLNICLNAREAMPSGGRLTLSASSTVISPSAPRPHPDAVPGEFVRIDIADTGSGIPDILKGRIFDPFFTTKGVGRGPGLGLSTAHALVKSHCGFITLVSTEGEGTTFSIFVPTAATGLGEPARGEPERPDSGPLPRGNGEHLLVVDDEQSVRLIMGSSLENFGYRVTLAVDGSEAIALTRSTPSDFDLAIVDMQMPGLDGAQTIVALRHMKPNLPIVGASGLATHENRELTAANGVRHFLDKPFSVEILLRTVHAAMAKPAS